MEPVTVKVVKDTCECDKFALFVGQKVLEEIGDISSEDLRKLKVIVTFDNFLKAESVK